MDFRSALAWGVIGTGVVVLVVLLWVDAPYGRHNRPGWGPSLPTRWAWVVMEAPPVFGFVAFFLLGPRHTEAVPLLLASLWLLHYVQRDLIYPFKRQIRAGDRTPWLIVAMAIVFNLINAYLNGGGLTAVDAPYANEWLQRPALLGGVVLFATGYIVNRRADATLAALRRSHPEHSYAIPQGGLYRYISCPNYFGEMLEWLGWALATWSLAGAAFFVFTTANLLPRALAHHRWYKKTFADYPVQRRAVVPFIL